MTKREYFPEPDYIDPFWREFNETGKQAGLDSAPVVDETDFDETFRDSTYVCRIRLIGPDGTAPSSLSIIDDLKQKYGSENVAVSAISINPDTQEKVIEGNGVIGVWVNSDAKAAIDNA